jgi:hypothetical protein
MKGNPIDHLVFECIIPKPNPSEPQNFYDFLRRHLVPEVRSETFCFYGSFDSLEAQYPGLDYSYPPHRMRLGRYTWHKRLFRAFDKLGLTSSEIAGLAKWEGTKWAKERYEKEHGMNIRDTTGDCIHDWVDPELVRRSRYARMFQREEEMQDIEEGNDWSESDMDIDSVDVELNEHLDAEEWEQWLKDAAAQEEEQGLKDAAAQEEEMQAIQGSGEDDEIDIDAAQADEMSQLFNTPTQNSVFVSGVTWGTQPTNLLQVFHSGMDTRLHK